MLRTNNASPSPKSRWLVSTEWLADHLNDKNVVVVDGSYLVLQKRDAHAEYRAGHIPGAAFFDVDKVADHSSELPHMLPGPTQFGEAVSALGIGNDTTVIIYDSIGLYSAPRVWWTFRILGAKNAYILDGGLPKWKAEGRSLETGESKRSPQKFHAEMNVGAVATLADMRMAVADKSAQIVDARSAERFAGKAPEPRPGLRSGHIPGAFNVPFDRVLDNGNLASRERVEAAFRNAGVDLDKPIITSCGSGMTAAILTFALDSIGRTAKGLYDGSWTEWGGRPDLPVERD
jgi:thiosulfate/3-mercaptopyruvate sulfurtransferase